MSKSLFVVFEGIDGSGKSSVMRALTERLPAEMDIILTAEPSDGPIGRMLREEMEELPPLAETLLFVADRAQHTAQIEEWLAEGHSVLCDRYYSSTLAYQSSALEGPSGDLNWLWEVNRPVILEPDLTILLDLDPATSLARTKGRDHVSKFEEEDFLGRVRQRYLDLAKERGFTVIDASASPAEVLAAAEAAIIERMEE